MKKRKGLASRVHGGGLLITVSSKEVGSALSLDLLDHILAPVKLDFPVIDRSLIGGSGVL